MVSDPIHIASKFSSQRREFVFVEMGAELGKATSVGSCMASMTFLLRNCWLVGSLLIKVNIYTEVLIK